jgi:hypothetical protein
MDALISGGVALGCDFTQMFLDSLALPLPVGTVSC